MGNIIDQSTSKINIASLQAMRKASFSYNPKITRKRDFQKFQEGKMAGEVLPVITSDEHQKATSFSNDFIKIKGVTRPSAFKVETHFVSKTKENIKNQLYFPAATISQVNNGNSILADNKIKQGLSRFRVISH